MSRLYLSNPCALFLLLHTVMRAQSAPGFPCALSQRGSNELAKLRRKAAVRTRAHVHAVARMERSVIREQSPRWPEFLPPSRSGRRRGILLPTFSGSVHTPDYASLHPGYNDGSCKDSRNDYGRVVIFAGGPGVRRGSASRANSHSSERVLRGSITSSTQNFSAERNGERSLFSRSSISFSLAAGSAAASISAR